MNYISKINMGIVQAWSLPSYLKKQKSKQKIFHKLIKRRAVLAYIKKGAQFLAYIKKDAQFLAH